MADREKLENLPDVMTICDLMLLGFSRNEAYTLFGKKDFPGFTVKRKKYVLKDQLVQYITSLSTFCKVD